MKLYRTPQSTAVYLLRQYPSWRACPTFLAVKQSRREEKKLVNILIKYWLHGLKQSDPFCVCVCVCHDIAVEY